MDSDLNVGRNWIGVVQSGFSPVHRDAALGWEHQQDSSDISGVEISQDTENQKQCKGNLYLIDHRNTLVQEGCRFTEVPVGTGYLCKLLRTTRVVK